MPVSDFVFLDGNDPEDLIYSEDQYEKGVWFLSKNIDMIPLSQLGDMLNVAPYKDLMRGFQPAIEPSEEGPYLLNIPGALLDKLKEISDTEITEVVPKWAQIEEFHGANDVNGLSEFLLKLREFLNQKSEPAYLCLSI